MVLPEHLAGVAVVVEAHVVNVVDVEASVATGRVTIAEESGVLSGATGVVTVSVVNTSNEL